MRLLAVLAICGLALLIGSGCQKKKVTPGFEAPKGEETKQAKAEPPKEEVKPTAPVQKEESKDPREIKTVQNIRVQAKSIDPQNDLKQIHLFYQTAASTGSAPTTVDALKEEMRTAPKILELVKENELVINLNGRKLRNDEILAYEREAYSPAGCWAVRANGQIERIPVNELKQMLNKK